MSNKRANDELLENLPKRKSVECESGENGAIGSHQLEVYHPVSDAITGKGEQMKFECHKCINTLLNVKEGQQKELDTFFDKAKAQLNHYEDEAKEFVTKVSTLESFFKDIEACCNTAAELSESNRKEIADVIATKEVLFNEINNLLGNFVSGNFFDMREAKNEEASMKNFKEISALKINQLEQKLLELSEENELFENVSLFYEHEMMYNEPKSPKQQKTISDLKIRAEYLSDQQNKENALIEELEQKEKHLNEKLEMMLIDEAETYEYMCTLEKEQSELQHQNSELNNKALVLHLNINDAKEQVKQLQKEYDDECKEIEENLALNNELDQAIDLLTKKEKAIQDEIEAQARKCDELDALAYEIQSENAENIQNISNQIGAIQNKIQEKPGEFTNESPFSISIPEVDVSPISPFNPSQGTSTVNKVEIQKIEEKTPPTINDVFNVIKRGPTGEGPKVKKPKPQQSLFQKLQDRVNSQINPPKGQRKFLA